MLTVTFVHAVPRLKCGCSVRTADAVARRPDGLSSCKQHYARAQAKAGDAVHSSSAEADTVSNVASCHT